MAHPASIQSHFDGGAAWVGRRDCYELFVRGIKTTECPVVGELDELPIWPHGEINESAHVWIVLVIIDPANEGISYAGFS